ncbi:MAG: hypothetical protein WC340_01705 [Kiritimatiellia bacterium]
MSRCQNNYKVGLTGGICALALLLLCHSFASAAQPSWVVAPAPCRISFTRHIDDYILTKVPVNITNQFVAAIEAYSATNRLPGEVIFNDGRDLSVLIDVRGVESRSRVDLYLVPGEAAAQPAATTLREATPLHGRAARTAGMDFPHTRQEVDSLATRFDRAVALFEISGFDQIGSTYTNWYNGDWQRKSYLVDLNTWILVPADGVFVFGLAGVAPAWLDVDQEEVLTHPVHQPSDQWTIGKAFEMKAGLHQVQVRTLCRQKIDTGVAWKRESEEGVASNVVMITGVELREGRVEWADRKVHPFFTVKSGEAYRFIGVDSKFVPFKFTSRSACSSGGCELIWNVADQHAGTNKWIEQTVASAHLPAKISLTAIAAKGGESAHYERAVNYTGPIWSEYEISSRITGVSAACYGDDKIHPIIRIKTSAKEGLQYILNSEIELVSGRKIGRSDEMRTNQGWGRQYLAEVAAGSVKSISWSLIHHGCELAAGRLQFQQAPFTVVPDSISGELFKQGEDFVALVVSKRSFEKEIHRTSESNNDKKIFFLDGFIVDRAIKHAPVAPVEQQGEAWQWLSLSALEWSQERTGTSALQSFTQVRAALESDVVLYAPSLRSIALEGGVDGFERRLAAMCALLTYAGGSSPRVILVVPPRSVGNAELEMRDSAAFESRQVAEIIVRVADAYGVETVDLFTAFEIAGNVAPDSSLLVVNGELTKNGTEFACEIIRRKL